MQIESGIPIPEPKPRGENSPSWRSVEDFIPLPSKNFQHRGITWSRSTLIRLADRGEIKMPGLRLTGSVLKRRMILRESLDAFIDKQLTA